jgi:hypothetical protein
MPRKKNVKDSTEKRRNLARSDLTGEALRDAMMASKALLDGTLKGLEDLAEGRSYRVSPKKD